MNKKLIIKLCIGLFLMIIIIGCVTPNTSKFIVIVNQTETTLNEVYVRFSGYSNWGNLINRAERKINRSVYNSQGQATTVSETARDSAGRIIYDPTPISNRSTVRSAIITSNPAYPNLPSTIEIRATDSNGFVYIKRNIDILTTDRVVITQSDALPILTINNNTGFPVRVIEPKQMSITSSGTGTQTRESSNTYQLPETATDPNVRIRYTIGEFDFYDSVILNQNVTVNLTQAPPYMMVENKTGMPIIITSPFRENLNNGEISKTKYPKPSPLSPNRQIISYTIGYNTFNVEAMLISENITVTVTQRPAFVTIQNNVGATIGNVQIRRGGAAGSWSSPNILSFQLNEEGTAIRRDVEGVSQILTDLRGTITNRDYFKFWMGDLEMSGETYDIRIDDINGIAYVKRNITITSDIDINFTINDKN